MDDYKALKPYKGYDVIRVCEVDEITGKRIGMYRYVVEDDDDMIGEEYTTISDAHRFIDSLVK